MQEIMMDFEEEALKIWSDISDALGDEYTGDQVRKCVSAIAKALEEAFNKGLEHGSYDD
jgi:hypothetical protein